jgi:hypothetical protein
MEFSVACSAALSQGHTDKPNYHSPVMSLLLLSQVKGKVFPVLS